MELPKIDTSRLLLRGFVPEDAPLVQKLAGDKDVAFNALNIPYPFPAESAAVWISTHKKEFAQHKSAIFAIETTSNQEFIGAVGLTTISEINNTAEMGYWLGKSYWNKGFASEAIAALIIFGFEEYKLNKIFATHLKRNAASGKVLMKNGFQVEGILRQHIKHFGKYEDLVHLGLLRQEYQDLHEF
ncbi:GNAT family N-acetyltransferase [Adhaeribacter aquaticus]|uniref:GNAT family N-acetyltransferase n=1 Tax=Adhaeribacter aquaticus TaxID=299567 RepID=UPI00041D3ECE|nr:GNAT family N-acetyltransferase [Adhaeribacter aquaticus]